jgi:uncharacterized protein YabE (DUF348 family)/3D (Asp-Asp-Asp) domain-containing protein
VSLSISRARNYKRVNTGRRVANKRLSQPGLMYRRHTGVAERIRVRAREMSVPTGSAGAAARAVASRLPIAKIALVAFLVTFAAIGILAGVNAFAKSRQMNIRLENGIAPMPVNIVTSARTVHDLLVQNKIRLGPNDIVTPAENTKLADGMVVLVNRAMLVFMTSKGKMTPMYVTGGTVEDALKQAHISCDQDDEVTPVLSTQLSAGINIRYVEIRTETNDEFQSIDYDTTILPDNSLPKGKTKVQTVGKLGLLKKTIEVTYRDDVETSRKELKSIVQTPAEQRTILKGTGSSTANTSSTSTGGSIATSLYPAPYQNVKKEDLVIPQVPSKFEEIYYMTITAYDPTGRTTAKGNWPQFTRTLKKPGTIAVDHNAIPYGTLLYVTGYGYCVAEDTGSNTVDSSRMGDVFMYTEAQCRKWGRRRNVAVYIVQYNFKTRWSK